MAERLCPDCGAEIPSGQRNCPNDRCSFNNEHLNGPDLWELMEHPERFDPAAARRRSRTKRETQ